MNRMQYFDESNRDMSIFYYDRLCNESQRLKHRLEKSLDKYLNSSATPFSSQHRHPDTSR